MDHDRSALHDLSCDAAPTIRCLRKDDRTGAGLRRRGDFKGGFGSIDDCPGTGDHLLDRAEILVRSRFDLKVKFPAAVAASSIRVTVMVGMPSPRSERRTYWIREVTLAEPRRYRGDAVAGGGMSHFHAAHQPARSNQR